MTPEQSAASFLHKSFNQEEYCSADGDFSLSECKYHIREAVAETYLSAVEEDMQIDILIDVLHALQNQQGKEAVASVLFGSPLLGIKKLRELTTGEVISRISDDVERIVSEQLRQEAAEYAI